MFWKRLTDESAIATGNFAKLFGGMEIPPLPQAAVRLIELGGQEEADLDEVAKVITSDPGISAKLMRTVNSAGMGRAAKVADVRGAVAMLGLERIRSLALGFAAVDTLPRKGNHLDGEAFWQTSLQQAVFAEALAALIARGSEGEAFTGALLQNMAQPILLTQWTTHYLPVLERARDAGRGLIEVEDEELSWNHAQAGAWLARSWGFPDVLVCCIGMHHAQLAELEAVGLAASPVCAVAIASRLPEVEGPCVEELGISEAQLQEILEKTDERSGELAELFGVKKSVGLCENGEKKPLDDG